MSYRDFEEFLESFNETGARYLVVGAHAVAFHARPRATQLGVAPIRIDLICSLSGIGFDEAWSNRVEGKFGQVRTQFLSLDDLIQEKRAAGRDQDQADVAQLLKAKSKE